MSITAPESDSVTALQHCSAVMGTLFPTRVPVHLLSAGNRVPVYPFPRVLKLPGSTRVPIYNSKQCCFTKQGWPQHPETAIKVHRLCCAIKVLHHRSPGPIIHV